jgi:hypothetical protein
MDTVDADRWEVYNSQALYTLRTFLTEDPK